MSTSGSRYRLCVRGRVSAGALELISERFDDAWVRTGAVVTVLELHADQPALRALLVLLWDLGHEVLAVAPATGRVAL